MKTEIGNLCVIKAGFMSNLSEKLYPRTKKESQVPPDNTLVSAAERDFMALSLATALIVVDKLIREEIQPCNLIHH